MLRRLRKGADFRVIKGINRQMIEIADTGSPYFERALLVLQGEADADQETLRREAHDLLRRASSCGHLRRRYYRHWISRILLMLGSAAAGALLTLLLS